MIARTIEKPAHATVRTSLPRLLAAAAIFLTSCALFVGGPKVHVEPAMTNGCVGICSDNTPDPAKSACPSQGNAPVASDALGTYLFEPGAPLDVRLENGRLMAEGPKYAKREWCVVGPAAFRTASGHPKLTYVLERDSGGHVTGLAFVTGDDYLHMPRMSER